MSAPNLQPKSNISVNSSDVRENDDDGMYAEMNRLQESEETLRKQMENIDQEEQHASWNSDALKKPTEEGMWTRRSAFLLLRTF